MVVPVTAPIKALAVSMIASMVVVPIPRGVGVPRVLLVRVQAVLGCVQRVTRHLPSLARWQGAGAMVCIVAPNAWPATAAIIIAVAQIGCSRCIKPC